MTQQEEIDRFMIELDGTENKCTEMVILIAMGICLYSLFVCLFAVCLSVCQRYFTIDKEL